MADLIVAVALLFLAGVVLLLATLAEAQRGL
jgi:hypothetical protein